MDWSKTCNINFRDSINKFLQICRFEGYIKYVSKNNQKHFFSKSQKASLRISKNYCGWDLFTCLADILEFEKNICFILLKISQKSKSQIFAIRVFAKINSGKRSEAKLFFCYTFKLLSLETNLV